MTRVEHLFHMLYTEKKNWKKYLNTIEIKGLDT